MPSPVSGFGKGSKEDQMFGIGVVVTMLVLRVIIPVTLLLAVGDAVRRRQLAEFRKAVGQA